MKRSKVLFLFFLVLIFHGGAHSLDIPGQHGHDEHGHDEHRYQTPRNSALAGVDHVPGTSRTLKQFAPSPGPEEMAPGPEEMAPSPEEMVPEENVAPAPALPPSADPGLGNGFDSNSGRCSAPVMKSTMAIATSIFFEFLHQALPDDSPLKSIDASNLTAWRSILSNSTIGTELWYNARVLAKEYFNMSLPLSPSQLKLPQIVALRGSRRRLLQTSRPLFTIPVYFIVISPRVGAKSVNTPNIRKQMAKLNREYAKARIAWQLKGIRWLRGDTWYNEMIDTPYDQQQKNLYRQGGPETLNVFVRNPPFGILGQAYFPQQLCQEGKMDLSRLRLDSITMRYDTLPGKSVDYNGGTLVHEAGHWLGVGHTFNQPPKDQTPRCDDSYGDMMSDTPVERVPNQDRNDYIFNTCNLNADSCPSLAGKDPVRNQMDYSPDTCMAEFTPQQISRMQWCYSNIRVYKTCKLPASVELGGAGRSEGSTGGSRRTKTSIFQSLFVLIAPGALLLL